MLLTGRDLCNVFLAGVFLLLPSCRFISGVESDINCLRSIKASLEDPLDMLTSSWDFSNPTEGFICNFQGIECWHPYESRVLNIKLADLGLKGQFPRGLVNCTSLTGLDLSSNSLSRSIPGDIHKLIPYVMSLDLSSNSFSGEIPNTISNCTFLNVLKLDNNKLTGQIPPELGRLSRLKVFSVANNQLSGPVPTFAAGADSYANNRRLCGGPLKNCPSSSQNKNDLVRVFKSYTVVMLGALGFGIGFVFSFSFFVFR
ncbi:putative non-specific serine/threonine protein kinase [Rosa chinensis]|uniref:Putative non-specific serine/threonine protein kinase n=1 Tax=Rosa chinensis TaxID=74649 RepID=A0A2P6PTJ6_ROSCH|nr:probably inactive leucine-rich repeat receptor-like protein kinase At5g48380 [Rosa chinensis]PRQ25255.1 putative non-specific serine/threonine protein kinase [Rosa chinensis]